jgi:hypothetical protein
MKITKSQLQRIIKEELQQVMEQERSMAQQIARDDWLQAQAAERAQPELARSASATVQAQRAQGYEVSPSWDPTQVADSDEYRGDAPLRIGAHDAAGMRGPKEREQISRRRGLKGPAAQQTQSRYDPDIGESLINDLTEAVLAKLMK